MNLKKKLRKFFTMARRDGGFTLVELVVVIAILGVLSGVAVPAYSGYVKKANIAADEALISDVKHALQLHYYSNPTENKDAYVVLVPEGSGNSNADSAVGVVAMDAVFGDGWENNTHLKYTGWKAFGNIGAAQAQAVVNSDYITNSTVPDLLDNVQVVTDAALGFMNDFVAGQSVVGFEGALALALDGNSDTFTKLAKEAGIYNGEGKIVDSAYETVDGKQVLKAETMQQISNLMVFSVAQELSEATPQEMQELMVNKDIDDKEYSAAAKLAAQYALIKAYSLSEDQEIESLNRDLDAAENMTQVSDALSGYIRRHETTMEGYYRAMVDAAENENPTENAAAFPAIMSGVKSVKDKYINNLKQENLFTSDALVNDLNAFVGTANAVKGLGNLPEGAIVVSLHEGYVGSTYAPGD